MSPMPKKRHLERDVKFEIKKLLDDHGWFWFSPTANQIAFLNSVRSHKHFGFVVNEARVDYLKAFLGAFDRAIAAATKRMKVTDEDGAMMLNSIREMQLEL